MKRLHAPIDVQIEVTGNCNENCRHCYNYWRGEDIELEQKELDFDGFKLIVDQLHSNKVGLITFTGGEPMLHKDVLFELIKYAHSLGIETGLNSNAVLIKDDDARIMAEHGLNHALISLLGPKGLHQSITGLGGNYEATENGIKALLRARIPVAVNMVVTRLNLSAIWETAVLVKAMGVNTFCAGPAIPSCKEVIPLCLSQEECKTCLRELMRIGEELNLRVDVLEPIARCLFGKEEDQEFIRFFGNRICSAAVSSCAISSSGDMRPCIHSDVIYGNVLLDDFTAIWEKMENWALPSILPTECQSCKALLVCEGGCRMSAKVIHGEYNGRDMYMTEPISDIDRVSILPHVEQDTPLSNSDLFEFNGQCIMREEDGLYIVYVSGQIESMTIKGYQFVILLKQIGRFTLESLAEITEYAPESLVPVINRLIRSRIVLYANHS